MSETSMDVVCAGILVADSFNEPVDRLPEEGELIAVDNIQAFVGGCAGNVAINLAKQQVRVAVQGKVGDDPQGKFVREALTQQGVNAERIAVSATYPTSQTMILLVKDQDRRFLHCFGANADFRVDDIDRDVARGAKVFYLGGYLVMPGLEPDGLVDLFTDLRRHGVIVVLDVVVPTGTTDFTGLETLLPQVDYIMPNDDEAGMMTDTTHPDEQARILAKLGVETVVITCGAAGSVAYTQGRLVKAGAYPTTVVDPSGGGDAFAAGLIAGLVRGRDLEASVAYGSVLGHSCVSAVGCHAGTFTADQATEYMEKNSLPEWIEDNGL